LNKMFEESKDIKAAEKDLSKIFEDVDKKQVSQLIGYFVKSFKRQYDFVEKKYNQFEKKEYSQGVQKLEDFGRMLADDFKDWKGMTQLNWVHDQKGEAISLGAALGKFMGLIEYGVVSRTMYGFISHGFPNFSGLEKQILSYVQESSQQLRVKNKNVKPKFITNRIEKIAQKHSYELHPKQRDLVVKIAAVFYG